MLLESSKIQKAGWKPKYSSSESIRMTTKAELKHQGLSTASMSLRISKEDMLDRLDEEIYQLLPSESNWSIIFASQSTHTKTKLTRLTFVSEIKETAKQ